MLYTIAVALPLDSYYRYGEVDDNLCTRQSNYLLIREKIRWLQNTSPQEQTNRRESQVHALCLYLKNGKQ